MNRPDKGRMTHSRYYRRTIQKRERFFHRVQIDLAFMGQNKKNYGSFFIGKVPTVSAAVSAAISSAVSPAVSSAVRPPFRPLFLSGRLKPICFICSKPKNKIK